MQLPRMRMTARLMMVGLAIVAVSLGWVRWQVDKVRHRRAVRDRIVASGGRVFGEVDFNYKYSAMIEEVRPPDFGHEVSSLKRLFGDENVSSDWVRPPTDGHGPPRY